MTNIATVTMIGNLFDSENDSDQQSNYTDANWDLDDRRYYLWMIMAWVNMFTTVFINDGRENITWKTMHTWRMYAVWLANGVNVAGDIQSAKALKAYHYRVKKLE